MHCEKGGTLYGVSPSLHHQRYGCYLTPRGTINIEWFQRQIAERNLSLRELSRRGTFSPCNISRIMRGLVSLNLTVAIQLAEALDVSVDEIVYRAGLLSPTSNLHLRVCKKWQEPAKTPPSTRKRKKRERLDE